MVSGPKTRLPGRREGFALLVVIVLLFAVGVTAAATYQTVLGDQRLAGFNRDAERAQLMAEAGALLFIGDAIDGPPPDTIYNFGGGGAQALVAEVSARRVVVDAESWSEIWRVRSEGRVTDPRFFDFPAIREVSRYARMRTPPFGQLGAVMTTRIGVSSLGTDAVYWDAAFDLSGEDGSEAGACPHHGALIPELAANGEIGGCTGTCVNHDGLLLENMGLPPWQILTDADYRTDYEVAGSGWSFAGLGVDPDDFPSVRVEGPLSAGATHSGRGTLIVTGQLSFSGSFTWDGIILARALATSVIQPGLEIRGILAEVDLSSLEAAVTLNLMQGSVIYDACNVAAAGTSIGVMNPEPAAWWSAF